jgi:Fe-S-cluster containining protein
MVTDEMLIDAGLLKEDGTWQCIKCGACCKMAECPILKDNLCPDYDNRPELCRCENFKVRPYDRARYCFMLKQYVDFIGDRKCSV